jgi:hypothetical protein
MNWLSNLFLFFTLGFSGCALGQTWKSIPNRTFGITPQYQTILTDKWGKTHIFIGYRRGNSTVGKNNPMVYYQVESKKLQIFDMIEGVLDPPKYDSAVDAFVGLNRQPMLIWKLTSGKDSATLEFLTKGENRVLDNMSFHWKKENDGWYYGTGTPKGRFFRFHLPSGKIENIGQAEFLNGAKNVRRTSFYSVVTPKGWAMNYRDDKNGGYYVYYQNRDGSQKYTVFLGKELTPSPILRSKNGSETIAIRVKNTQKKVEWRFFDELGNQIIDASVRFPEDFEQQGSPTISKSASLKKVALNGAKGVCSYLVNGKPGEFAFNLPVDLQKMEWVVHHPKWGWVGTSGKYQDVYFLDSTTESAKFSFRNDAISTYALGGTEQLIIAGYPSKIALFDGDSLNLLVSKNSFPKYFVSIAESPPFVYFLGKNDRDRTGFEVWRYHSQTKVLDQPWEVKLDSVFTMVKGEGLVISGKKILLFCRTKAEEQLKAFELTTDGVETVDLPRGIRSLSGSFSYAIHPESGLIGAWFKDSILIGNLRDGKDLGKCFVGTVQKDKNTSNKSVLAFVQPDQLLISGWNEKKKKGEVLLVDWKKKKSVVLKDNWEQPRPFSMNGKKEALFFGGSLSQNERFELLTLPSRKK